MQQGRRSPLHPRIAGVWRPRFSGGQCVHLGGISALARGDRQLVDAVGRECGVGARVSAQVRALLTVLGAGLVNLSIRYRKVGVGVEAERKQVVVRSQLGPLEPGWRRDWQHRRRCRDRKKREHAPRRRLAISWVRQLVRDREKDRHVGRLSGDVLGGFGEVAEVRVDRVLAGVAPQEAGSERPLGGERGTEPADPEQHARYAIQRHVGADLC